MCSWSISCKILAKFLHVSCVTQFYLFVGFLLVFLLVIWQPFKCIKLFFFLYKGFDVGMLQKSFLTCLFLIFCSLTWFNFSFSIHLMKVWWWQISSCSFLLRCSTLCSYPLGSEKGVHLQVLLQFVCSFVCLFGLQSIGWQYLTCDGLLMPERNCTSSYIEETL